MHATFRGFFAVGKIENPGKICFQIRIKKNR
jgi:hypothetical protein